MWLAEKSASLFYWRKRMAKDKDKKKKNGKDSPIREYDESLELLKAKHEQLDGLIREANLFLQEIKEIRDGLKNAVNKTLDE